MNLEVLHEVSGMSAATEHIVSPETLSNEPPQSTEPACATTHTSNTHDEAHSNNESSLVECRTTEPSISSQTDKEPQSRIVQSQNDGHQGTTGDVQCVDAEVPVKDEPKEEAMQEGGIKEELYDATSVDSTNLNRQIDENSMVGKLKIKPMASLVETNKPNPLPGMHPFFAGFDDHIRSLIMNRRPQFAMNSSLMQRPGQFMYYDNTTNMNLKKMLNGHKMGQVSVARHQTFRPYVPINVPRPPRSQVHFRAGFSTQTPPMSMEGQPVVTATPSSSRQWPPQNRPQVHNLKPNNDLPAQNISSPENFIVPSFTPANDSRNPKFISSNNCTSNKSLVPNISSQPVPNLVPQHSNKVSTSSSTDDLEKHSSENSVIIKTEVDLGIDSKEEIQATLNECNLGTHFMDSASSTSDSSRLQTSDQSSPNIETTDSIPQIPLLTGDAVTPAKEEPKRHPAYDLPAYSTKGCMRCKCCDFRCNQRKKMKEHFDSTHTAENHYKCFYCIKKLLPIIYFKSVHDLEHHVGKVHRAEKRWQCKSCTKSYKSHMSYRAHVEKACSQSRPYACHMCTFTCVTEAALEKHIKSHEKLQETQQCPFCQKFFKRFYMKQHLITVHAPPEERPFRCQNCDFGAGTQAVLDNHYKRTGHDRTFKCDLCDYSSRSKSITKAHVRSVHEKEGGADRLVCGIEGCKVKCVNSRCLKAHRQMHTMSESELFVCPNKKCSMKFPTSHALRYHITKAQHHKPFECPDCSLRFLKEESLSRHIQSIHVNRILKKCESKSPPEPVCVKNVVDVYHYVESGGLMGSISSENPQSEDDSVANFGCWLGISGFGDITDKTDCDIHAPPQEGKPEVENEEVSKVENMEAEEHEEDEFQNLVPITCLVELKQDEAEENSISFDGKPELALLKKEEEDENSDSEYQHVNPQLSCLVECQQDAKADSSTETNINDSEQLADCSPANFVKIEVEDAS